MVWHCIVSCRRLNSVSGHLVVVLAREVAPCLPQSHTNRDTIEDIEVARRWYNYGNDCECIILL